MADEMNALKGNADKNSNFRATLAMSGLPFFDDEFFFWSRYYVTPQSECF